MPFPVSHLVGSTSETTSSSSSEVPVGMGLFSIPWGCLGVSIFPNTLGNVGILFIPQLFKAAPPTAPNSPCST